MCGFAGIVRADDRGVEVETLGRMAAAIRHRGPDGYGFYTGRNVGLAHVRLSIVDIEGGAQPMSNEDGRLWVVFNGEIYNHVELRRELESRGHRFRTRCDTEVIVHGYEEWGAGMLHRFNGQFAFALHDRHDGSVLLARDRFGVRPLFHAVRNGDLYFGSEIKALLASGEVRGEPSLEGLDEVFTFWAARPPRTVFRDIWTLEPGTWARWSDGRLETHRYYEMDFGGGAESRDPAAELDGLMHASVDLRMRADVPVGGYLSGGLDSSITCAMAATRSPYDLRTFSVTFSDPRFDESGFQRQVAEQVGSRHAIQPIGAAEVGEVFPAVIRQTETPLVRTAPAPLYLLSRLTRENGIKVVLTGEGADEVFLGYDLFKETAVRRFCLRQPGSAARPQLFHRLYPYLDTGGRTGEFWRSFFLNASAADDPLFSHMPRFTLTSWIKEFYSAGAREAVGGYDALEGARDALPGGFAGWSALNRAAYLEFTTLLSPYLLSSQGDRMALAHGVEGRFPFLDHRLFELAAALPARHKLAGLREKVILRQWARSVLPPELADRPKQPYRAPDIPAFFGDGEPEYVADMLDAKNVEKVGLFDPAAVAGLVRRCRSGRATGFRENQALVAVLSTQLWHEEFCAAPAATAALPVEGADVMVSDLAGATT